MTISLSAVKEYLGGQKKGADLNTIADALGVKGEQAKEELHRLLSHNSGADAQSGHKAFFSRRSWPGGKTHFYLYAGKSAARNIFGGLRWPWRSSKKDDVIQL